jgi:hypothetical protein
VSQPTLFGIDTEAPTQSPRCRMCARPARLVNGHPSSYCAGGACTSHERLCQGCGLPFKRGTGVRNNKYCSHQCAPGVSHSICTWCERPRPLGRSGAKASAVWPYICAECTSPIRNVVGRLRDHRVPHEMARRLIDDPGCEICGIDLIELAPTSSGKRMARLVVDHDHGCCGGSHSCGRCVRGFLCGRCNSALGMMGENLQSIRKMTGYLERYSPNLARLAA